MAISVEAGFPVLNTNVNPRSSITQSITVGSGTGRLLLVGYAAEHFDTAISSATFNTSESLSKHDNVQASAWSRVEWWLRAAPSTTTANVVLNLSASDRCGIVIYVLDGVDGSTPVRAANAANKTSGDSGSSSSRTINGWTAGDYALDLLALDSTGHNPLVNANNVGDFAVQSYSGGEYRGSRNTTDATMAWTWTTAGPFSHLALAAVPAPTGEVTKAGIGIIGP